MLTHKCGIYVTSTTGVNVPAPQLHQEMVDATLTLFALWFGGATVVKAQGAWMSESFGLVKEDIAIVYAYCTEAQLAQYRQSVFLQAAEICRRMTQEAVSVEIDGALYFQNGEQSAIRVTA